MNYYAGQGDKPLTYNFTNDRETLKAAKNQMDNNPLMKKWIEEHKIAIRESGNEVGLGIFIGNILGQLETENMTFMSLERQPLLEKLQEAAPQVNALLPQWQGRLTGNQLAVIEPTLDSVSSVLNDLKDRLENEPIPPPPKVEHTPDAPEKKKKGLPLGMIIGVIIFLIVVGLVIAWFMGAFSSEGFTSSRYHQAYPYGYAYVHPSYSSRHCH